jgi:hypothetical protein
MQHKKNMSINKEVKNQANSGQSLKLWLIFQTRNL